MTTIFQDDDIQTFKQLTAKVQVYDVCGKLIQTLDVNSSSKKIDISNLAAGMYFIRAISENEAKTISFVKK